jgi:hypothetical protein
MTTSGPFADARKHWVSHFEVLDAAGKAVPGSGMMSEGLVEEGGERKESNRKLGVCSAQG